MLARHARRLAVLSQHAPVTASRPTQLIRREETSKAVSERPDLPPAKPEKPEFMKRPFVKELFIGEFDKDVLVFPEMEIEEVQEIEDMVKPIEKFFTEQVDSKSIDRNAEIPKETLDGVKQLGLFGQQIPPEYGGLGLNATKYARLAEVTAMDGGIAVTLAAHQAIGLKGLLIAGSEEQKQKYLPRLATGEQVAAFCLTEPSSGSDAASIQTRATWSEDKKKWLLNGSKIWISNGGIADVFTVFAKTTVTNSKGEEEDKVTAFFVEREFGGVTSGKPEDKLGIRGSNTTEVHFDNTPVPPENVIGEVGKGFKLAMNILNSGRFSMGSSGAGMLKRGLGAALEYAANRKQFGKNLIEFGLIQEKVAKLSLSAYAMESMSYMTSGMLDSGEYTDCSVEAAMVKIYSSEECWRNASEMLQVFGGSGYMRDLPYERYVRDSRIMLIFEGTNEILRLFVALNGMQYAGEYYKDMLKVMKSFWRNPRLAAHYTRAYVGQKMRRKLFSLAPLSMSRNQRRYPSKLELERNVHPVLKESAKMLSSDIEDFGCMSRELLVKYKKDLVHEQMLLSRVADMSINVFAMTACISRASRSKCIGLKNCDHEVLLATTFCYEAHLKNLRLLSDIESNLIGDNLDQRYRRISKEVEDNRGYIAEHPLTKLW